MTLELLLILVCIILAEITVKTLILFASLDIQLERVKQRTTNALVKLDDLEAYHDVRLTQLESVIFEEEDSSDYEAPVLTPYGAQPGWKGENDVVQ